jgi:hypothetical protein
VTELGANVRPRVRRSRIRHLPTRQGLLLYDVRSDATFEGNAVALEILELLDGTRTCAEIARQVAERYGVPLPAVLADVAEFVRTLRRRGIAW